jgi:hypothetical protein
VITLDCSGYDALAWRPLRKANINITRLNIKCSIHRAISRITLKPPTQLELKTSRVRSPSYNPAHPKQSTKGQHPEKKNVYRYNGTSIISLPFVGYFSKNLKNILPLPTPSLATIFSPLGLYHAFIQVQGKKYVENLRETDAISCTAPSNSPPTPPLSLKMLPKKAKQSKQSSTILPVAQDFSHLRPYILSFPIFAQFLSRVYVVDSPSRCTRDQTITRIVMLMTGPSFHPYGRGSTIILLTTEIRFCPDLLLNRLSSLSLSTSLLSNDAS